MGKVLAADTIALYFLAELDFTDWSEGFGEIRALKLHANNSNSWFSANFKWVFKMFVFIRANIFFLKLKML